MSSGHQLVRVGLHYGSGKAELGTMCALLMNLSDNCLEQIQNNTVVTSQKEMDRVVGVEPTTSIKSSRYLKAVSCS